MTQHSIAVELVDGPRGQIIKCTPAETFVAKNDTVVWKNNTGGALELDYTRTPFENPGRFFRADDPAGSPTNVGTVDTGLTPGDTFRPTVGSVGGKTHPFFGDIIIRPA